MSGSNENKRMEHVDNVVFQIAVGNPTDEEKEQLIKEGYTFMSWGKMNAESHECYEVWLKS